MLLRLVLALSALVLWTAAPPSARAQSASGSGFELALYGAPRADAGGQLRVAGVAYATSGLATLRAASGARVVGQLSEIDPATRARRTVAEAVATADREGRFALAIDVPERTLPSPQLEITLSRRAGEEGRRFQWPVGITPALEGELRTDRARYEPGETLHVWARLFRTRDGKPEAGRGVRLVVSAPDGTVLADRTLESSRAGVATSSIELPRSAQQGDWRVVARVDAAPALVSLERAITVSRRTVERLLVEAALDQSVVSPGAALTGRVVVRTPSGAPIRGARVEVRASEEAEAVVLETDAEGVAPFSLDAPAFLSGDVAPQTVAVRATHPAHGTLHASASYIVTRVRLRVEAQPSNAGLVPDTDAFVYLGVSDPRGAPAPAGTQLTVTGASVRGGRARLTVDARGLAAVPVRLPSGSAAPVRAQGLPCYGQVATLLDVTIEGDRPQNARVCAGVAPDAEVRPHVLTPVVAPGAEVAVEIQRRPAVRGRAVLVEALVRGVAIAATWVDGNATRGAVTLPRDVAGVVAIRARAARDESAREPLDDPGATALGAGALDAVLVRPPDAFTLAVEPGSDVFRVRERARVAVRATPAPPEGFIALVARDLAAHGGEEPWTTAWLGGQIDAAAADPSADGNDLLLRAALASAISVDPKPVRPAPLVAEPWEQPQGWSPYAGNARGQLRDPLALREELLRRGLAQVMLAIERAVAAARVGEPSAEGVLVRRGDRVDLDPRVVQTLIARRLIAQAQATTLGGETLTLAMLTDADPSFTFDRVARRVARQRLVTLLVAMARFVSPDDPNAARASANEPPERWLSRMQHLGLVQPAALVDPWGRPFVLRRVGAGRAAVLVSERAPDYELVSPGPDGRAGTADDVRDPFARIVPARTPYAVASGEDALIAALSSLSPGPQVLNAMAQAYRTIGLAAIEEQQRGAVTASVSEEADAIAAGEGYGAGYGGLGLSGSGRGGGGVGQAMPSAPPAAQAETRAPGRARRMDDDRDGVLDAEDERAELEENARAQAGRAGSRLAAMGELVRERFPATLHFLAEAPLRNGLAVVEIPLADALTTYRVEAIAWTPSGWATAGSGELRVDQDAMVDAPVPAEATVGDVLRLPVRVANRTGAAIQARIEVEAHGVRARVAGTRTIDVPPGDAVEVPVEIGLEAPGTGHFVVRAVRASGGALDAVRRPIAVRADARLVHERREVLLSGETELEIVVPAQASDRGAGELRIATGSLAFGDPMRFEDRVATVLVLAGTGRALPAEMVAIARSWLESGDPHLSAAAVGATWSARGIADGEIAEALDTISEQLVAEEGVALVGSEADAVSIARLLLALSPATKSARRRPALQRELREIVARLVRDLGAGASRLSDAPVGWAWAGAGLAASATGEREASRARELVRRAERFAVRVGEGAWIESPRDGGHVGDRVPPTAALALALASLGERDRAMPYVRHLIELAGSAERWPDDHRAIAAVALARAAGGPADGRVRVRVGGRDVRVRRTEGGLVATLDGIGRPGSHEIEIALPEGALGIAWLDVRYGLPWDVAPERTLPIAIAIDGPLGARDTRAGLAVTVRNRGVRLIAAPVLEIDMPAGAELDEATRSTLASLAGGQPIVEGRTLRLPLRPLAPGGYVRLPLPARWSVGGRLRGLGAVVTDASAARTGADAAALLPSRALELGDRGSEPAQREPGASPPPPPRPIPLPPIEPLLPRSSRDVRAPRYAEVQR